LRRGVGGRVGPVEPPLPRRAVKVRNAVQHAPEGRSTRETDVSPARSGVSSGV
jgi:hypothetical protein